MNKQELKRLIDRESPLVLDIGCYDGKDSKELSEILNCEVHCFEPDPLSQDLFNLNHGNNPRLHLYPFALADKDGHVDFYQSNHPQSNSIHAPKEHLDVFPGVVFDEVIKVQIRRLDSWLEWYHQCSDNEPIETIDFIWADVNGAEKELIMGGQTALSKTRYLYIELSKKELYEGQLYYDPRRSMNNLRELLPDFRVLLNYNWGDNFGNVLLKNIKL